MTRWGVAVPCPQPRCDGEIEVWLEEIEGSHATYMFCCTQCDTQGEWEKLAKRLLAKANYSGPNVRRSR